MDPARSEVANLLSDDGAIQRAIERLPEDQLKLGPVPSDRITLAGSVYHQSNDGGDPVQVDLGFERVLETREQVFQRRLTVGEEWEPLVPERCWLPPEQVGLIVICNEEGKYPHRQPSAEERAETDTKVLEISSHLDDAEQPNTILVPPCERCPITFSLPACAHVRARPGVGTIRYAVHVFPR